MKKNYVYILLISFIFSDLTCEHSNLCGSGDFLVLVANVHHVEDPGGAEAGQEEGQEEAEEAHDECSTAALTPAQLYTPASHLNSQY